MFEWQQAKPEDVGKDGEKLSAVMTQLAQRQIKAFFVVRNGGKLAKKTGAKGLGWG